MPLPDYPAVPGNKPFTIHDITGPASYAQVSNGTPPTGGQAVNASDMGLVDVEFAMDGYSDNGQYVAQPILTTRPNGGAPQLILRWVVAATGAEASGATNLSARTVRIAAIGH